MASRKLTTWQAASIVTGYGVGSGIMALPYLVTYAGTIPALLLLVLSFFLSFVMHMMLAELCMGAGRGVQIVGVFRKHLIRGRFATPITWALFIIVALVLLLNLAAYVSGGAELLTSFGVPTLGAQIAFYLIAAVVVFFGLKVMGISESVAIGAIIVILAVLAGSSVAHASHPVMLPTKSASGVLAFFGMSMTALVAFFSVPQAVEGLDHDPVKVRRAIMLGLGLNCLFILVIVTCALASSTEVTQLAMVGWSAGIGSWAQVLGTVFTFLAMLTTYWSISLALADILHEQLGWNERLCWLLATLPSLLIVLTNFTGFFGFIRTAGGLIAILIAFMVVPAYRNCRREQGELLLPKALGSTPMQALVIVSFLLMAAGNLVSV